MFYSHYIPPQQLVWQGRVDSPPAAYLFQTIQMLDLQKPITITQPALALIGFSCDEGIRRNLGRVGAAQGPLSIREILARFPALTSTTTCFDAGDITCFDGDLESAQHALGDAISLLLQHQVIPIVLGGGHELAWGHFQGIHKIYPHKALGIINFDAHLDMRPLLDNGKGSSGTPFLQIAQAHHQTEQRFDYNCIGIQSTGNIQALLDTATQHHVQTILADDINSGNLSTASNLIQRVITENDILYVSLCLDVFAAAFAPGVSAPQAMGVLPYHIMPFIKKLAASHKVIGYDIAELSPHHDIDSRTAKLAANFVFEILHHHSFALQ